MKNMKLGSLVSVVWLDSTRDINWTLVENMVQVLNYCESIGWLICDKQEFITIAGHKSNLPNEVHYCGAMTIPKCAVKTIRRLKG
jgi:hypothetical protein